MTVQAAPRLMTAEELAELPEAPSVRYELVRGELRCMSPSFALPGVVAFKFSVKFGSYVEQHDLGVCGTAESAFKIASDPDTVRAPDVWFVRKERIPPGGIPDDSYWPGVPDLAVEVLSPSDRFSKVMEKMRDYLDAGTPLVWVFDPVGRTSAIFRPDARPILLDKDGVLDGGETVPGFSVRLRDLLP
jgi:Uma2 family endonuclease